MIRWSALQRLVSRVMWSVLPLLPSYDVVFHSIEILFRGGLGGVGSDTRSELRVRHQESSNWKRIVLYSTTPPPRATQ